MKELAVNFPIGSDCYWTIMLLAGSQSVQPSKISASNKICQHSAVHSRDVKISIKSCDGSHPTVHSINSVNSVRGDLHCPVCHYNTNSGGDQSMEKLHTQMASLDSGQPGTTTVDCGVLQELQLYWM